MKNPCSCLCRIAPMVLIAVPLFAADVPPGPFPRWELRETLGASVNLPGVQNALELSWRWDRAALGVAHVLQPSSTRIHLWAEWVPVAPLSLRAGIEPAAYFGASGALLSYDRYDDDFGKDARDARQDESAATGGRAYLSPSLRLRVSRFVASSTAEFEWWRSDAVGPLFYEPSRDTLLEVHGDRLVTLTTTALYEHEGGSGRTLAIGANHRWLRVAAAPANDVQRLGGVLRWTLGERRFGVRQPSLVANAGVYLEDRFKQDGAFLNLGVRFLVGR